MTGHYLSRCVFCLTTPFGFTRWFSVCSIIVFSILGCSHLDPLSPLTEQESNSSIPFTDLIPNEPPRNIAPQFDTTYSDRHVYITEPIDFYLKAHDPDFGTIRFFGEGLPAGAFLDSITGKFSWRPAIEDTAKVHDAVYMVSDGEFSDTARIAFTVEAPTVTAEEGVRVLRPNGREHYLYGDTMDIAFVMVGCGREAWVSVGNLGNSYPCDYSNDYKTIMQIDGDSVYSRGFPFSFFRKVEELNITIGYYRVVLVDTSMGWCDIDYGGGVEPKDSLWVEVRDPYARDYGCPAAQNPTTAPGYFSVVPRYHTGVKERYGL